MVGFKNLMKYCAIVSIRNVRRDLCVLHDAIRILLILTIDIFLHIFPVAALIKKCHTHYEELKCSFQLFVCIPIKRNHFCPYRVNQNDCLIKNNSVLNNDEGKYIKYNSKFSFYFL